MQDPEKLREIESIGEPEEGSPDEELWEEEEREEGGSWSGVPLLQAVICALAVLALVFFRVSDDAKYQEIGAWYKNEMAQELELPVLERATPKPSYTPEPTATPTPAISASAPQQML